MSQPFIFLVKFDRKFSLNHYVFEYTQAYNHKNLLPDLHLYDLLFLSYFRVL